MSKDEFVESLKSAAEKCFELKEENIINQNFLEAAKCRDIGESLKHLIVKASELER